MLTLAKIIDHARQIDFLLRFQLLSAKPKPLRMVSDGEAHASKLYHLQSCLATGYRGRALAAMRPLREIARRFGVSKDAARRHGRHMPTRPEAPEVPPELLFGEIPTCWHHECVPFWLQGREWVCGECIPWDGRLAYWRMSGAPLARELEDVDCDEYRDTWVMVRSY